MSQAFWNPRVQSNDVYKMSEMFELDNLVSLFFVECTCSWFEATFTINGCSMASEEEARTSWSLHSKNSANDTRFFSVSTGNFLLWIFHVPLCLVSLVTFFPVFKHVCMAYHLRYYSQSPSPLCDRGVTIQNFSQKNENFCLFGPNPPFFRIIRGMTQPDTSGARRRGANLKIDK